MIVLFLAVSIFLFALLLWGRLDVSKFLRTTSAICDEGTLNKFKSLARRNMYGAVAYMIVGAVYLALGFYLVVAMGLLGVCLVLLFSVPSYYLSTSTRKLEIRSRTLECTPPELQSEYLRVGHSWLKRLLPDF